MPNRENEVKYPGVSGNLTLPNIHWPVTIISTKAFA